MNGRIYLDALARRERGQTEWKENVADVNDVVVTLCAFANDLQDLGGGYVVCGAKGAKDEHDFPSPRRRPRLPRPAANPLARPRAAASEVVVDEVSRWERH